MLQKMTGTAALLLALAMPAQADGMKRTPFAQAFSDVATDICLAYFRGDAPISEYLPEEVVEITDISGTGAFSGQLWSVKTLEGEVLVGTVSNRGRACQVIGQTPFGDIAVAEVSGELSGSFQQVDVDASSVAADSWRRFVSDTGEYVDVTEVRFAGVGRASVMLVVG